jgi:hypothetical protein
MLPDDDLDVGRLVACGDDEPCGIASNFLVLGDRERSDPLQTQGVRTFADQPVDEVGLVRTWRQRLSDLGDPLVHLTKERLVFCQPREAWLNHTQTLSKPGIPKRRPLPVALQRSFR